MADQFKIHLHIRQRIWSVVEEYLPRFIATEVGMMSSSGDAARMWNQGEFRWDCRSMVMFDQQQMAQFAAFGDPLLACCRWHKAMVEVDAIIDTFCRLLTIARALTMSFEIGFRPDVKPCFQTLHGWLSDRRHFPAACTLTMSSCSCLRSLRRCNMPSPYLAAALSTFSGIMSQLRPNLPMDLPHKRAHGVADVAQTDDADTYCHGVLLRGAFR
jgi:hypothetical protein